MATTRRRTNSASRTYRFDSALAKPAASQSSWARRLINNFATIGLSLLFGVVGLVWFSGSSSKESDSRALPVSLVEHCKPELVSVNIEEIQLGDYVLAKDPITGEVAERKVLQTFARISDHLRVLTLRSESGEEQTISTTDEHPFFVEGNHECEAGNLRIGDKIVQSDGQFAVLIDTHREEHKAGIAVYNFEVKGFHTYFVSAQGARAPPVWVHNASYAPKSASESLPQLKGRSEHEIGRILQDSGYTRTKVSNSAARNETWNHPDGSEVRIHPCGNANQAPYRSANNAHVHRQDPLGNQLNDRGFPSTIEADTHIGIPNPPDLPIVRGRQHGAGTQ